MISRFAWYAILVVIGLCTAALQLDRQSATMPIYAGITPEPVRSFAQAQIVAQSLRDGDAPRSLREAKVLVNRRPMPAETLRLLAQAQFAAGLPDEGFVTIQIAARRGWRDPVAQESMMRLAADVGDEPEAAKRYLALLLKRSTPDSLLQEFGGVLFGDPDSQAVQTLGQIVTDAARWQPIFMRRGARVMPAKSFARIITTASDSGTKFNCGTLTSAASQLETRDKSAAAQLREVVNTAC